MLGLALPGAHRLRWWRSLPCAVIRISSPRLVEKYGRGRLIVEDLRGIVLAILHQEFTIGQAEVQPVIGICLITFWTNFHTFAAWLFDPLRRLKLLFFGHHCGEGSFYGSTGI